MQLILSGSFTDLLTIFMDHLDIIWTLFEDHLRMMYYQRFTFRFLIQTLRAFRRPFGVCQMWIVVGMRDDAS